MNSPKDIYFGKKIEFLLDNSYELEKDFSTLDSVTNINGDIFKLDTLYESKNEYKLFSVGDNLVCKLYSPKYRCEALENKIKYLIDLNLDEKCICKIKELVYYEDKFVGFIREDVKACPIDDLSNVTRETQLKIINGILDIVSVLHSHNILLTNYSLDSFLVDDEYNVYFRYLDETQVDIYPSMNLLDFDYKYYTSPRIIKGILNILDNDKAKVSYYTLLDFYKNNYYYKIEDDLFALLTFIFKYMFGNYPYISKLEKNVEYYSLVCEGKFPYSLDQKVTKNALTDSTKKGIVSYSHVPYFIKKMFIDYFTFKKAISIKDIKMIFSTYIELLGNDSLAYDNEANVAFPLHEIDYSLVEKKLPYAYGSGLNLNSAINEAVNLLDEETNIGEILEFLTLSNRKYVCNNITFEIVKYTGILYTVKVTR